MDYPHVHSLLNQKQGSFLHVFLELLREPCEFMYREEGCVVDYGPNRVNWNFISSWVLEPFPKRSYSY